MPDTISDFWNSIIDLHYPHESSKGHQKIKWKLKNI